MPWIRHRTLLQMFAFTYGPIKGELRGTAMSPRQWGIARGIMLCYSAVLLLALGRGLVLLVQTH